MTNPNPTRRDNFNFIDGEIVVAGTPPYDPPQSITVELVKRLFSYPQGHEFFLPTLAADFSSIARSRLLTSCRSFGGDMWAAYKANALKWATLTSDDGKWHVGTFFMIYEADVGSPWISRIAITDRNIRLVQTPIGWLTFAEFMWRYDMSVQEHLETELAVRTGEHELFCAHIRDVIEHVSAELVIAPLIVASDEGVGTKECVGLQSTHHKHWRLPDGLTFLDESQQG